MVNIINLSKVVNIDTPFLPLTLVKVKGENCCIERWVKYNLSSWLNCNCYGPTLAHSPWIQYGNFWHSFVSSLKCSKRKILFKVLNDKRLFGNYEIRFKILAKVQFSIIIWFLHFYRFLVHIKFILFSVSKPLCISFVFLPKKKIILRKCSEIIY